MATRPAIRAERLGKRYRLGERQTYRTLVDALAGVTRAPSRAWRRRRDSTVTGAAGSKILWALRDACFEVAPGEVLGIIVRNGAGKSTLLKVLSRITEPTEGFADVAGRVASLLEVGSGLHPELTGSENIYLLGATMGMTRAEIRRKFDEIVAFAEVEKFVDTPVKRFSSGMYMRLAFSVSAHLEPDILVIDEVLAVGDAAFQKKCLGKMDDVAHQGGRTVLFVSHNMDAVRRLCDRAMWLEGGRIREIAPAVECTRSYLMSGLSKDDAVAFDPPHRLAGGLPVRLCSAQVTDGDGVCQPVYSAATPLAVRITWETVAPVYRPRIGFVLQTVEGVDVLQSLDVNAWQRQVLPPGRWVSTCLVPGGLLNEGSYLIDLGADGWADTDEMREHYGFTSSRTGPLLRFDIEDNTTLRSKHYGQYGTLDVRWPGVLLMDLAWQQEPAGEAPASTLRAGA